MGRPCKCCGECEEVQVSCYIVDDIVHIDIDKATSARITYRIAVINPLDPNAPYQNILIYNEEDLDNGSLRFTIPLSELIISGDRLVDDNVIDYGVGVFYNISAIAYNSCSSNSCFLSCDGGIVCGIDWIDAVNEDSNVDFCRGVYKFRWYANLFEEDAEKIFNENSKFFINGDVVTPSVISDYQASGTFVVSACDLADAYRLSIEADFCSGTAIEDCSYIPTCLMKKNSLVKEITGIPDTMSVTHRNTRYHFDGEGFCGEIEIVDVRENTITGLSAYNGTHIFDKCGVDYYEYYDFGRLIRHWNPEVRKVGEGVHTVKDTRTTFYRDTFGTGDLISSTTVNEWVREYEYFVEGTFRGLMYRDKQDITSYGELFAIAYPCPLDPPDQIYGGIVSLLEAQNLDIPRYISCEERVNSAGVESSGIGTRDPNPNIQLCCRPMCRDESTDPPILDYQFINSTWVQDSEWDSCTNETRPPYRREKFGSYKVYYDCL